MITPPPPGNANRQDYARALTKLRKAAGLSVRQVAERTGLSPGTISGYFCGRALPSRNDGKLDVILSVLNISDPVQLEAWHTLTDRLRLDRSESTELDRPTSLAVELLSLAALRIDPRDPGDWPQWQRLRDYCQTLDELIGVRRAPQEFLRIQCAVADHLRATGLLREALTGYGEALERGPLYAESDPAILALRHGRARVWGMLGRPDKAEPELRAVLELRRLQLGADHPDTMTTLHYLARAIRDSGRVSEALDLLTEVGEAREARLGPDHRDSLTSANNLGETLVMLGREDEAEGTLSRVLAGRMRVLGAAHPATLITRQHLVEFAGAQGDAPSSLIAAEELLETSVAVLGPIHPRTLDARFLRARFMDRLEGRDHVRAEYAEVFAIRRVVLGDRHPATREVRAFLGA